MKPTPHWRHCTTSEGIKRVGLKFSMRNVLVPQRGGRQAAGTLPREAVVLRG
jgi:hypothetical protein